MVKVKMCILGSFANETTQSWTFLCQKTFITDLIPLLAVGLFELLKHLNLVCHHKFAHLQPMYFSKIISMDELVGISLFYL